MHEHESCECSVCKVPHFERNNYFHGKMLSARDLGAEQRYFNEKRWLINRMVIGWGIVCGLDVGYDDGCLSVTPGLALDCCGRELLVCDREVLHANAIADELHTDPCGPARDVRWALCLEYRECKREPVRLPSSCDQKERGEDYNRIRDDYRFSVRLFDDACPEDHDDHCCAYKRLGRDTSIHRALVTRSLKCPTCAKCECVLLATGTLKTEPNKPPHICLDPDSWKYRRVVYTNPALAGFIRCFHDGLAHITGSSWKTGARFKADEFLHLLSHDYLKLTFDKPLNKPSVENPRSCRLSAFVPSGDNGCPSQVVIPVKRVVYADDAASYYFDHYCAEHELRKCQKRQASIEVEFVLHGSMVLDAHGRALDAELIRDFPTGNGVEAGEFIAWFSVEP